MAVDLEMAGIMPAMVSTRRLEGTLVASDARQQVPNHLTETRLFRKSENKGKLKVLPNPVLFEGYKLGALHQHTMRIVNTSSINQSMHIIPPKTSFFSIKYFKKQSALVPGLSMNVVIEFKPTGWQYYYDCVRIHCQGEENILIPIHAYPVMSTASFPHHVDFEPTPVGQSQTKSITLKCDIPVEFEYQLSYVTGHPAFAVDKMKGVIPANGEVNINVVYSPKEFSTAVMQLKLEISQYNSTSKTCTFSGTSIPGLALDKCNLPSGVIPMPTVDSKRNMKSNATKLYGQISREQQRLVVSRSRATNSTLPSGQPSEVVHKGHVFPANLDVPSAVSKVLLQEAGKMKASQVKKVISGATSLSSKESGVPDVGGGLVGVRQLRQAAFLQQVQQVAKEERANHLRWVTCLGDVPMTDEEVGLVHQNRDEAMVVYQHYRRVTVLEDELARTQTMLENIRTTRNVNESPDEARHPPPTFDLYTNNMWARRQRCVKRFVQAGRKIIIRLRCQQRLQKLQRVLLDLNSGKTLQQSLADVNEAKAAVPFIVSLLPTSSRHICPFSFPNYSGPTPSNTGEQDFNAVDNKLLQAKAISVADVKTDTPFVDLQVPRQSEILGYSEVLYPYYGSYMPPGMPRQFLSGAEDEIANLSHVQGVDPAFLTPYAFVDSPLTTNQEMRDPLLTLHASTSVATSSTGDTTTSSSISRHLHADSSTVVEETKKVPMLETVSAVVLDIENEGLEERDEKREFEVDNKNFAAVMLPSSLLEPPDCKPMQILNPIGGVTSFFPLLPHSEVMLDHALLPLPPYPTAKHPHVRPDPSEVIPALMNWKMFPSSWLISAESDKKLASVWKPCLSNAFSSDLLPSEKDYPSLLSGVQPDDYVDTESMDTLPVPTEEMIKSSFMIPGQSSSKEFCASKEEIKQQASELFEEAKSKLEIYQTNQFNQLGRRVNIKLHSFLKQLDSTTDEDAIAS